jgi:hypothetical protein
MPDGNGLCSDDNVLCRTATNRASTTQVANEKHAGSREHGEKQADDDEKTSTAWPRS